ncbi:MAG: hypothetical protein MUC60_12970 [Oscillatoria sp. Prado101]|nr:hypothetical protein [Oscillatoria sp. Prado101]
MASGFTGEKNRHFSVGCCVGCCVRLRAPAHSLPVGHRESPHLSALSADSSSRVRYYSAPHI